MSRPFIDPSMIRGPLAPAFKRRIGHGSVSRDLDPADHFCVMFAAYSGERRQVLLGHHRKSDLWLFNGGHVDGREALTDALFRETGEEWGTNVSHEDVGPPRLLTITDIEPRPDVSCRRHYDIWYFVNLDAVEITLERQRTQAEFRVMQWLSCRAASRMRTNESTRTALRHIDNTILARL